MFFIKFVHHILNLIFIFTYLYKNINKKLITDNIVMRGFFTKLTIIIYGEVITEERVKEVSPFRE